MDTGAEDVGRALQIFRYPVKSMLGEEISVARIGESGIIGDRAYAVVDNLTGKVASAKHPRLWRGLLRITAQGQSPFVRLHFVAGESVMATDVGVDARLSRWLGREVRLDADAAARGRSIDRAEPEEVLAHGVDAQVTTREGMLGAASPGMTFHDFAPLHLITTSTLRHIAQLRGGQRMPAARYRANLVIKWPGCAFVENGWVGRLIAVGDQVVLRVIVATPRCAVPTLAHGDLAADADALRIPARHNRLDLPGAPNSACAGVYAQVVRQGDISRNDRVRLLPAEPDARSRP